MADYEVFVSYAHIDNQPLEATDDSTRWVTTLRLNLESLLERKIGKSIAVWMDESELRGNEDVTPEINTDVGASTTLVAIVSKAYLNSTWCRKELEAFLAAPGRERHKHVFVVLTTDIAYQDRPAPLQDKTGYQFFETDRVVNRTWQLAVPKPIPTERAYYHRLDSLAQDMADVILSVPGHRSDHRKDKDKDKGKGKGKKNGNGNGAKSATVYLAEVGSELYDEHGAVKRFLEEQDYEVLPEQPYSRTPSEYSVALDADLHRTILYVQLLGRYPGVRAEGLEAGYEGLQFARATQTEVPILRWRSSLIDLAAISDVEHRAFISGPDVLANEIEEFKDHLRRQIEAALFRKNNPVPVLQGGDQYLLLAADEADESLAQEMAERLRKASVAYNISQSDDLTAELKADLYDGVMVFYGSAEPAWVQEAVLKCRRAMVGIKPNPPEGAICVAPPLPERPILSKPPRFQIVELCEDAALQEFLDRLTEEEPKV